MDQNLSATIYIISRVQASKARGTPQGNRYNSPIGLDITNVKCRKLISQRGVSICIKISNLLFQQNITKTDNKVSNAPDPKF